jgi:hypothetical protein
MSDIRGQPGLLGQERPVDFPRLRLKECRGLLGVSRSAAISSLRSSRRARCDGVRLVQTDSNSRETRRVLRLRKLSAKLSWRNAHLAPGGAGAMSRIRITPLAEQDLLEIWYFIAQDDPLAATPRFA